MKKIRLLAMVLLVLAGTTMIQHNAKAQVNVNFQLFYDDLDPYGDWISYPDYGYVWVPQVGSGFIPYRTNGHWVYTYDGWTWVSNYRWGWAPFHYGRWFYDSYYGWVWVPDDEWGPGWVSWRSSNDYYGWAPLEPGISITIDLPFNMGYDLPYEYWTFVPNNAFGRPDIYNYYVDNSRTVNIYRNTTVINNIHVNKNYNTRYNAGPVVADAEKRTGRKFKPVSIRETGSPEQKLAGNELQLYRPRVQKNNSDGRQAAPKVVKERAAASQPKRKADQQRQQREQQRIQQQQQQTDQQNDQRIQKEKAQQRVQQEKQQRDQQRIQQQQREQQQKIQKEKQQRDQQRMQQQQREQQRIQQQRDQQRIQQQQQQQRQQQRDQQRMQQQQREQQRVQQRPQQQMQQQQQPRQKEPGNPNKKGKG